MRVVLGDETGIIRGFMFGDDCLDEGNTVVVFKGTAPVVKEHVEVQVMKGGRCEKARR
mgnify:CR=1 FL=1